MTLVRNAKLDVKRQGFFNLPLSPLSNMGFGICYWDCSISVVVAKAAVPDAHFLGGYVPFLAGRGVGKDDICCAVPIPMYHGLGRVCR
jgi:hypothetical protein